MRCTPWSNGRDGLPHRPAARKGRGDYVVPELALFRSMTVAENSVRTARAAHWRHDAPASPPELLRLLSLEGMDQRLPRNSPAATRSAWRLGAPLAHKPGCAARCALRRPGCEYPRGMRRTLLPGAGAISGSPPVLVSPPTHDEPSRWADRKSGHDSRALLEMVQQRNDLTRAPGHAFLATFLTSRPN